MRLWIALTCALALGCGGSRQATGTGASSPNAGSNNPLAGQHRLPQKSSDVHVVVTAKAITINGVAVSGKPRVTDLEAIFGKPDRTWDSGGANKVHTWDTIGLLVYEPYDSDGSTGDGRCISATFPYKAMGQTFSPKAMFGGTIQLDGKALDPTLSLKTVLKWPGATQPYTKASLVFDREDFHVFTIEEKDGTNIDLVEISFWQKGQDDKPARKPVPRVADLDEDDCKNGDVPQCTNRALAHQSGTSGRRNFERAFELVQISCAGGDVFGCVMLGNMHDAGKGTKQSKPEATTAWKRACTLGYKPACAFK